MGVYYRVINRTKREQLDSPHASKEFEWNHPRNPSSSVVLWALFTRWKGDQIDIAHDAGDWDEGFGFYNAWPEVERDYLARLEDRGLILDDKGAACPHGFAWHASGHCQECFPSLEEIAEAQCWEET